MSDIASIKGREILDSRGNPTVEVDVTLSSGVMGRASVPSGASTGSAEALELRDENPARYRGKGVLKAVAHVNELIAPILKGQDASDQETVDRVMIDLDGTPNKLRLGANAILGVSMAVAKAAAIDAKMPLYRYLGGDAGCELPVPMVNMISGGLHASKNVDFQDYLMIPLSARTYRQALMMVVHVYRAIGDILLERGIPLLSADEGGYSPPMADNEEALKILMQAVEMAGYEPGEDVVFALDVAASHFYVDGQYKLAVEDHALSRDDLVARLVDWVDRYPILSIEDGMQEEDWNGWKVLSNTLNDRIQVLGDDLFTTNTERLARGIHGGVANAVLIKMNQIGTLTETFATIRMAQAAGYLPVVSARSGETEDATMSDLAVATCAGQFKVGSVTQSDRLAKYNQLLRIEEELGARAVYRGRAVFERFLETDDEQ